MPERESTLVKLTASLAEMPALFGALQEILHLPRPAGRVAHIREFHGVCVVP
jgi:hypothetical protein